MISSLAVIPVHGLPMVVPGDALADSICLAVQRHGDALQGGDIVVVCQKVVSKAEGRVVSLDTVEPSLFARRMAASAGKDARLVELVLRESRRIVKMKMGHLICETGQGWVCANAGVDESNSVGPNMAILLPEDPDRSAALMRERFREITGQEVAVVISDTFGRPWREGLVEVALGVAGIGSLVDYQGRKDLAGRDLKHTIVAIADHLAAAAGLVMEKDAGVPAAIVRGYSPRGSAGTGQSLIRPSESDLFR